MSNLLILLFVLIVFDTCKGRFDIAHAIVSVGSHCARSSCTFLVEDVVNIHDDDDIVEKPINFTNVGENNVALRPIKVQKSRSRYAKSSQLKPRPLDPRDLAGNLRFTRC